MTVDIRKDGTTLTLCVEGRLDTNTSPDFEAQIKESLDGVTALTIDIKDLVYISSAGLRVLLSLQKRMNEQGSMKVTNVCDDIMEIFEVTGFSEILTIE